MKSKFEIFLDTDILLDKRIHEIETGETLLEKCLRMFECYTSVVNATEVFSECKNGKQVDKAKNALHGVNILGIPFRYSISAGNVLKRAKRVGSNDELRNSLIISMCLETKLALFTLNPDRYKSLSDKFRVKVITKEIISWSNSPEIIFKKAKIL